MFKPRDAWGQSVSFSISTKQLSRRSLRGKGNNLLQVQQMTRHENMSTTLGYFHEFQRIKNAAKRTIRI